MSNTEQYKAVLRQLVDLKFDERNHKIVNVHEHTKRYSDLTKKAIPLFVLKHIDEETAKSNPYYDYDYVIGADHKGVNNLITLTALYALEEDKTKKARLGQCILERLTENLQESYAFNEVDGEIRERVDLIEEENDMEKRALGFRIANFNPELGF